MDAAPNPQSGWQVFALGSAVFAAATAIFGKLGVSEINSNLATFLRTTVVLVVAGTLVSIRKEWEPLSRLSRFGLLMLLLSGVATGLSWLCYYRALKIAPASLVAPVDKLSVAIVIVFAIVCLGEPLSWKVAIGGILITAGVLVLVS